MSENNTPLKSLLTSRRFWLAIFGIVQSLVLQYFHVSDGVWLSINGLVVVMIAALTVDDTVATNAGLHPLTGKPLPAYKHNEGEDSGVQPPSS